MAVPRSALRLAGCYSCRQWALRSFIASIGGRTTIQQAPHQRAFSTTPLRLNEARERIQKGDDAVSGINDIGHQAPIETEAEVDEESKSPAKDESQVPWYLQVQSSPTEEQESPMAARQRLPDLPEHPPPILQSLLEHVSIELGMDDLSLLDLRTLDPPPALGANLLMIIGTARSEKHLHVSADKLCRWLRSEYKMTPYADGLLGRNELKLKMKRRAKRSRLLSAVGSKSTADSEIDEGIRTGWVCVNVGRVEGGDLPEDVEKVQRQEGIVGFGARTDGCRIVAQLMTEEKRGEIDLEKLWTGILNRAQREREREKEASGESVRQILDPAGVESSEGSVQRDTGMTA